jgi:type IX secretion system PorP/SprF family membrane protein
MLKRRHILFLLFMPFVSHAQDAELPPDFRQHNLTEYNANLFNPIFSLDRNEPRSLALWTRWQWQSIDGDPTTYLFNYTHRLNPNSAGGLGFFQHNTGLFLHTGAIVNYAYNMELGRGVAIAAGLNAFAYQRKPADDIFQPNPDIPLPQFEVSSDFIVQFAPSLRFRYNQFGLGLVGENLLNYNFTTSGQDTEGSNKIYIVHMNYSFPIFVFGTSEDSYIRPTLYIKTLPGLDDQIGIMGLFSTPKFWAQTGYNSFYGLSAGAGGRFFKDFSIGALVEFGSENTFQDNGTSIEFVTAYNFGEGDIRRRVIGFDEEDEDQLAVVPQGQPIREQDDADEAEAEAIAAREQADAQAEKQRDSIAAVKESLALATRRELREERRRNQRKRERDSLAAAEQALQLKEQRLFDSIAKIRREDALAAARKLREDREKDSLAKVALAEREAAARQAGLEEKVTPEPGEKYEETTTEVGLAPGYYLIANVFGTKKYFEAFMKTLSDKGLQPKSFFRSVNKYNYVYLQRYDTIEAARDARNSKYNGRYSDNLWVFRVVAN